MPAADTSLATPGSGPASQYDCALSVRPADAAFTGADGTASEIGWEGNYQGVVTCLGGVFYIQDVLFKNYGIGFGKNYGFGIYDGGPTTWTDADGYLPAQITSFSRDGARVSITEFCDKVVTRWRRLCRRLQPGRRDEPDRPRGRGEPRGFPRIGAARYGARCGGPPHLGRSRLRDRL